MLPKVVLHHPVLSVTAGHRFMQAYHDAKNGKLGAPYVVIQEGSVADEDIAGAFGGYWSAMGADDETGQPIPTAHWLRDLAPGDDGVLNGEFTVTEPGIYGIELLSDGGVAVAGSPEYAIDGINTAITHTILNKLVPINCQSILPWWQAASLPISFTSANTDHAWRRGP